MACMVPRGIVGMIYKEDLYTLLHTKYESSQKIFFFFHIVSLWDPELMTHGVGSFLTQGLCHKDHSWKDV